MQTCRQYWQNLQGRCLLNFNWDAIDHDSVVLVSASEYRPNDADPKHSPRFVGDATITVDNISPHGPPFDPNHGVTFVITVDWDSPLEVVTDIIVLDVKPIDKGWGEFRTVRLPYTASGTDLGANTLHNGNLYVFFGDYGPDFDKPICLIPNVPPVAFDRSVLAAIGDFLPFEYRIRVNPSDPPRHIGQNQTPNGAFSYDGHCYVLPVYDVNPPDVPYGSISVITRSADPLASAGVFDQIAGFDIGTLGQIAPVVVQSDELSGLPPTDAPQALIMIGQSSGYAEFGDPPGTSYIRLAWMPLRPGAVPNTDEIRFLSGFNPELPSQPPVWDFEPWNALRLIKLPFWWSSVSLGRIPPTGQWILLYQKALGPNDPPPPYAFNAHGIFARIGSTPWEWSEEFEIFNPDRDGAWATGLMDDRLRSFAYGAFLLQPFTEWDPLNQSVTIYYLMSTGSPYQAVVMRSTIKVPPV
jgi:hypothetical protein